MAFRTLGNPEMPMRSTRGKEARAALGCAAKATRTSADGIEPERVEDDGAVAACRTWTQAPLAGHGGITCSGHPSREPTLVCCTRPAPRIEGVDRIFDGRPIPGIPNPAHPIRGMMGPDGAARRQAVENPSWKG